MLSYFKDFKNMRIANRLSWSIGTVTIVALTLLSASVGYQTYQLTRHNTQEITQQVAYRYAYAIKSELEIALNEARALAKVFEAAVQADKPILNRDQANQILKHFIETRPNFLGTWVIFEPNAFDGKDAEFINTKGHDQTGRFIPYWVKNDKNEVILEPSVNYETEDFYQLPKKHQREQIIEPFMYPINGKDTLMTSAVVPIFNKEKKFVGVVSVDILFENLSNRLKEQETSIAKNVHSTVYSQQGKILLSTNPENEKNVGKNAKEAHKNPIFIEHILSAKEFALDRYSHFLKQNVLTVGLPITFGSTQNAWTVTISVPYDELYLKINNLLIRMGFFSIILAILLVVIIYRLASSIAQHIQQAVTIADSIAEGHLSIDIPVKNTDETGLLMGALKNMSINLAQIVNDVQRSVAAATSGSQALSATSQQLMRGATNQSEAAEEISASMEQMSASIKQTSENAKNTEIIATQAATDANQTGQAVDEAISVSQQIIQKLSVIEDISKQINILSLNASIEAARAGQHGKGFKVVAASIRELAGLSHRAATEINALSSNSMQTTQTAKSMLNQLVSDIQHTATLMRDISTASHEQSINADQVNQSIAELHKITQQNASASEELATMAEQLSTQAQQLSYTITYLKVD
jgi:methyl-accepting chemotaxis protein